MALIEGFRIENFRVLKKITMGRLDEHSHEPPLTPFLAVIGKNGTGKSTLFDTFGFLSDSLASGVEEACSLRSRGGFERLVSSGVEGSIRFELCYRETPESQPITYELSIAADEKDRPYVLEECLRQSGNNSSSTFFSLNEGKGFAWTGEEVFAGEKVEVSLTDKSQLGIAVYGVIKDHPRISRFRDFLKGWYLSYFIPDAAKGLPKAGPQRRLNARGDNLGNVVQYMEKEHKERFGDLLHRVAGKIPGVDSIKTKRSDDGRLLLCFNEKGFKDPFYANQMSDGTLKLLAYMLMLEDPQPPPFIGIEEPENGLYHKLLEVLAAEFRAHTTGKNNPPQILVTTHQPYFINALRPEETWILEKGLDGFARIKRAADDPLVCSLVSEGLPLGGLWYSDYFDARA
ncbi:MAG: AAA family ATPase [Candidatus Eremiobacteraeota bacterium]|nr:AAA family ATPase [Candidatus Eremiobacteraeota bacterium]